MRSVRANIVAMIDESFVLFMFFPQKFMTRIIDSVLLRVCGCLSTTTIHKTCYIIVY
jgi:hypothetical protein